MEDKPDNPQKRGRPPGSRNKKFSGRVPTNKEIADSIKECSTMALDTLVHVMKNGSEINKTKSAIKVLDTIYELITFEESSKNGATPSKENLKATNVPSNVKVLSIPTKAS